MILKIAVGALILYVAACALMYFSQERFLFHPTRPVGPPSAHGLADFKEVRIPTADGLSLTGWLHEAPSPDKAVIYFYGNADSLAPYAGFFQKFAEAGYSVLGVNYRGYGGSEGVPSEKGFYTDADAALAFMTRRTPVEGVTLIGRSIGTGVAIDLAAREKVASLALISPYTSVLDRASELYWFLPVRLLSKYVFGSLDKIRDVSAPVLIVHGDRDTLIPLLHAETLYAAAKEPKRMEVFAGADHIFMDLDRIARLVIESGEGR